LKQKIKDMSKQEILENIKRLEKTISMNIWNEGYVSNCKEQIENYKKQLENASNI
jgi:hypothetical protein